MLIPEVSLPSENVPAPPSPNWILELVSNFPVWKNVSTSFFLSSTFLPCSIIIGSIPFFIKVSAANSPAGPAPTITGRSKLLFFIFIFGNSNFL